MINLPYGGKFNELDLMAHIKASKRKYIIQGQQSVSFSKHTKPNSLDYWLRQFGLNKDTKQAENSVIDDLVATGFFKKASNLPCPDSGRLCKGLIFI